MAANSINQTNITIFEHELNGKVFTVELVGGEPVYKIDGVETVTQNLNDFLGAATAELGGTVVRNGTVNENALEHFGGRANPFIRQQDAKDDVVIGGGGVRGQFKSDFDNDAAADAFQAFANDLLGKDPKMTKVFEYKGGTNGGANKIQILQNDEIIDLNDGNPVRTADAYQFQWSGAHVRGRQSTDDYDEFVEAMGELFGGVQTKDGTLTGHFNQTQANITGDGAAVTLGAVGVGGKEVWQFDTAEEAQNFLGFFDSIVDGL